MKETLREKQSRFVVAMALLILQAEAMGYKVTLDYAKRCDDCPVGMKNSLHKIRLAIDINLFKWNGKKWVYCRSAKDYEALGAYWKATHDDAAWGGDFSGKDARHFSFEYRGVK